MPVSSTEECDTDASRDGIRSGQNSLDHLSPLTGEALLHAMVEVGQLGVVQAHQVQHRGVQIGDVEIFHAVSLARSSAIRRKQIDH